MNIAFHLNGERVQVKSHPLKSLLEIIRSDFRLKGTKQDCRAGECGSCLVFLNGLLVNSCLVSAFRVEGKRVMTIEGFVKTKEYLDIEQAFLAFDILYCGFCTPSLILAVESLLGARANPTKEEIAAYLTDNLCSYSGSSQIIEAVSLATEARRKRSDGKRVRFDSHS